MPRKHKFGYKRGRYIVDTKIAAVCCDKVDGQTLRTFMSKASAGLRSPYELMLFAKPSRDVSAFLTVKSGKDEFDLVDPLEVEPDQTDAVDDFLSEAWDLKLDLNSEGDRPIVSHTAIIQLDEPAASRDGICFVCVKIWPGGTDGEQREQSIGFRCAFSDVPAAVAELDDLRACWVHHERGRRMRNEAAMCGGVWKAETIARLHAQEGNPGVLRCHLEPTVFPPFKGKPRTHPRPYETFFPLFITASNITVATINELLAGAFASQNERNKRCPPSPIWGRLCIVTNVDRDGDPDAGCTSTSGPAEYPLEVLPALPKELLHASPEACLAFARSRFPAQADMLEWGRFVLIDEFTETDKTVLVGAYQGDRGLILQRNPFDYTVDLFSVVENTPRSVDTLANAASRTTSGVAESIWATPPPRLPFRKRTFPTDEGT